MRIAARISLVAWFIPALAFGQPNFAGAVKIGEGLPRLHALLASRYGELILEHYFHGTRATSGLSRSYRYRAGIQLQT